MVAGEKPERFLERPRGNRLIPYGTPTHITELFLRILKVTFAALPDDSPYHFDPENYEGSNIAFDVSLNKDSGVFGKKPLIVVSRGPQSTTSPQLVGDVATVHLPTHNRVGTTLAYTSLNISVISKAKAEVEVLSQYIFSLLLSCRTHFHRVMGMHMASEVSLTEVSKFEDDDSTFLAQLSMQYSIQYKWNQQEFSEVLRGVGIDLSHKLQN